MMKRLLLIVLFLGIPFFLIHAQSLNVGTKQASVGDTICLDLKTANISNMLTAQFTIDYFYEHLEYIGIDNYNLSQDPPVNSFSNHIPGYVTFSWISDDLIDGYSLSPDEVIFEVCFKALTDNVTVPIYLTGSPTNVEITDKDLNILNVELGVGLVVVGNGNMIDDPVVSIPDPNFKADILGKGFDLNSDNELQESEAKDIFSLQSNDLGIETAEGIEYFSNLTSIKLIGNNLTELDVSNNLNLISLECQGNSIESLELAPDLEYLNCSQNQLESLTLGSSPKLSVVLCSMNMLDYLEVSNLWQLRALDCSLNLLDDLIIDNNSLLELLACSNNSISVLDLSNNQDLYYLDCSVNQIEELNLEDHLLLEDVYCHDNLIEILDLNSASSLEKLDCSNNNLSSIVFNQHPLLSLLKCGGNGLSELNLSSMEELFNFECQDNNIGNLDLSNNPMLSVLDCSNNLLSTLDLSINDNVSFLNCSGNVIQELGVVNLKDLVNLDCSQNLLSNLDLFELSVLSSLNCSSNSLSSLDLSTNAQLNNLDCSNNELLSINLVNDTTTGELDFSGNPDMAFICVDEIEYQQVLALVNAYEYEDCQILFDCMVSASNPEVHKVELTPNLVTDFVRISNMEAINRLFLVDQSGKVIKDWGELESSLSLEIDLGDLKSGVYILMLQDGMDVYSERIIKL